MYTSKNRTGPQSECVTNISQWLQTAEQFRGFLGLKGILDFTASWRDDGGPEGAGPLWMHRKVHAATRVGLTDRLPRGGPGSHDPAHDQALRGPTRGRGSPEGWFVINASLWLPDPALACKVSRAHPPGPFSPFFQLWALLQSHALPEAPSPALSQSWLLW